MWELCSNPVATLFTYGHIKYSGQGVFLDVRVSCQSLQADPLCIFDADSSLQGRGPSILPYLHFSGVSQMDDGFSLFFGVRSHAQVVCIS